MCWTPPAPVWPINLSSPPKQISALTTLSHQQEAEIRQQARASHPGLRTDTSRMTEVLEQYDETLSALDELEVAWQQQTLVQEIIALRQQLLGVAEDDVASLPDADAVEDTPPEAEQDSTDAESADDAGSVQPEETAETVSRYNGWHNSLPNWTPCITTSCWFPRMSIKNRLQR